MRGARRSGARRARTRSRYARASTTGSSGRCASAPILQHAVRDIQRYRDLLAHTVPLAVDLGHEPTLTLWDGDEVLCACDRCSARGYGDVVDDVMGGALFEDECPNEAPPKITALTMTYVPSSRRPSDSPGGRDRDVTRG